MTDLKTLAEEWKYRDCDIDDVSFSGGSTAINRLMREYVNAASPDAILKLLEERDRLREALVHSVTVIQDWHNMDMPQKQRSDLWDIYWRNAPEMKKIRAALEGTK